MKTEQNFFMSFFSSIRLTLFTLFALAVTSIIGTVIPQKEAPQFYIQEYGANWANLFHMLNISDMYNSPWFLSFLILLSINLIVCTINRFPNIWKLVTADILSQDPDRLEKMANSHILASGTSVDDATAIVSDVIHKAGWKTKQATKNNGQFIGSQKGAWTRLGVVGVHASIIIIFLGAIIGSLLGYKAHVMIPEGMTIDRVNEYGTNKPIPLEFQVRCDRFSLSFYDNGAPKEYRSDLTVYENGKETLKKSIVVNDPLNYKGLTFYQSSYEGYNEYLVQLEDKTTNEVQQFLIPPSKQIKWKDDIKFGILNMQGRGPSGGNSFKIWFKDATGDADTFWLRDGETKNIKRTAATYEFYIKQRFATGLQVAKDPGVWYVYFGCTLMILGLIVAFFLSHRRIWVFVTGEGQSSKIILAGSANKNKIGLERDIDMLASLLKKNEKLNLIEE